MDQLGRIVRLVDDVIGPAALGTYLHGSAALGGLRPASDIDVMVVTRRSLDGRQRRALVDGLLPVSGSRAGTRPVEVTVVVQSDVRPWRYPPTGDFLYGDWLREQFEAGVIPQPQEMPNLATMIPMTLAANYPLDGPQPADLLDPVPAADVARGSVDGIPDLLADLPGDTRNVVLTLARIWSTIATGEIRSKDAAARWALARLAPEHRPVLDHARHLYLTTRYRDETWNDDLAAQVPRHVDAVLAEISRLAPASS